MASELTVQTIKGPTSGANANKVIIPSGHTLAAAGHVMQVLDTSYNTQTTMSQGSWVDIGLSLSITPTSTSSKILVYYFPQYRMQASSNDTGIGFRLLRGSTALDEDTTTYQQYTYAGTSGNSEWRGTAAHLYFDSPNSTSAITYKVQGNAYSGSVRCQDANNTSRMLLMEIAQ